MIFFAVALLLVGNASSFNMPSLSRRQSILMMDPLGSDANLVTPKSIMDSTVTSSIRRFPIFAGPIVGVIAASISKVLADDATTDSVAPPVKVELGPAPTDFGLIYNDYYSDCQKVVNHMRYASQLEKGNPLLADVAQKTKDEMGDFVSYYRRFPGISGKQSFSLLYTSINVLAGHYTSYGVKFPVPEKRKKRLLQEFNDIEKNIRKKR
eukprot:gene32881-42558_t